MIVTKFGQNRSLHARDISHQSVARRKKERTRDYCALRARTFGINILLIKGDNLTFDHLGNDRLTGNNDNFDFLFKTNNLTP